MMNEIRLSGIVGKDFTADSVAEQLKGMTGDITIDLNSPGGSYFIGAQIFNEFRRYPGKKTIKMGSLTASAAAYISCAGDEIIASDNTAFMIHEVSSAAEGTAAEIAAQARQVEKLNTLIAKRLAERSKKTESEIRRLMQEETWYYGQEIVDAGFADRLEDTGAATDRAAAVASAEKQYRHAALATQKPATIAETMEPRDPLTFDWPEDEHKHENDYSMIATESAEALLTVPENKSYIRDGKTTEY
jgi:ATP-dependent protease ClpP protease subunit